MIILRQKEFGNKANKAAKRKWELEQGKNIGGVFKDFNIDDLNDDDNSVRRFRIKRNVDSDPSIEDVKNVDQAINYRNGFAGSWISEKYSHDKDVKNKEDFKNVASYQRKKANELLYDRNSGYKHKLKFNNTRRKVNKFIKDNKKALTIGAAALGTSAAIAGGLAYGIGKAREGAKRYRLDVYKKDREAIRQELEEEQKKNKKSKKSK